MILNERGLTLAEILVAVAVIGIGLVGLAVVIPVSTYGVQEGNQLSTATFLAEQMIERARAAQWTGAPNPADCLGVSNGNNAPIPTGACTGGAGTQFPDELTANGGVTGYPQYQRIVRVTDCGPVPGCAGVENAAMRLVQVTVIYTPLTAGGGAAPGPKTVRLEWLVSRK
jgi:prepilin-type N-terminal cleavage/methylation domain-containing protein